MMRGGRATARPCQVHSSRADRRGDETHAWRRRWPATPLRGADCAAHLRPAPGVRARVGPHGALRPPPGPRTRSEVIDRSQAEIHGGDRQLALPLEMALVVSYRVVTGVRVGHRIPRLTTPVTPKPSEELRHLVAVGTPGVLGGCLESQVVCASSRSPSVRPSSTPDLPPPLLLSEAAGAASHNLASDYRKPGTLHASDKEHYQQSGRAQCSGSPRRRRRAGPLVDRVRTQRGQAALRAHDILPQTHRQTRRCRAGLGDRGDPEHRARADC